MADTKSGRNKQAHDVENRQRRREISAELERGDEPEPPIDATELTLFEAVLEPVDFPATGPDVLAAVGDHRIAAEDERYAIVELLPETDVETFESPAAVRKRVQRPTVAETLKRVVEAVDSGPNAELSESQRDAYVRTFLALETIDAVDDEGIRAIGDWIVEQIDEKGKPPESRAVRRQAATFCRAEGHEIRNDEWLGV